jgi:hypothetical protein
VIVLGPGLPVAVAEGEPAEGEPAEGEAAEGEAAEDDAGPLLAAGVVLAGAEPPGVLDRAAHPVATTSSKATVAPARALSNVLMPHTTMLTAPRLRLQKMDQAP